MLKRPYKKLYSKKDLARAVSRLGSEITPWCAQVWKESRVDVLAIPVLRGGLFFFADLVRAIDHSVEVLPLRATSYQAGVNGVQRPQVIAQFDTIPAKGRHLLLVDDICDSGRTLKVLSEQLWARGALAVRSAVLVKREVGEVTLAPDWVGFGYKGSEWLVGYGMEDAERWRNLPYVGMIEKEVS